MTVEDQRVGGEDASLDGFPVGMRVLAVDDDPICLIVLENLLRKCQYQVTTTNQAIKALNMLRENRNKFDLVISDVNMPDMDGFKLLELVGLEMDLPVIMLSAYSDTKLVMKGVTHGACDYLLKPIRIEELKNIWQHVVRRRKSDAKEQSKASGHDKPCQENGEGGKEVATTGNEDQNAKLSRKRKDQNEEEEEEGENIGHENDDPSTQKKPRVVWSPELHRKFVAAVQQLGVDKAFPKKILDLMNVEGLTRENVASHLQKFRAYLKKASMKPQHTSVVAALGGNVNSYTRTGALEGFEDLHALAGSITLANTALSPSPMHGRMLHRLNSSAGLTLTGITSTGLIQPSNLRNLSNNTLVKFQPSLPLNQRAGLFQGILTSSEVNQSALTDPTGFAVSSGLQDTRVAIGCSSTVPKFSSNALMLPGHSQQTRGGSGLGNCSSNFLNHKRSDESWQGAVQPLKFPSTALPMSELLNSGQMHCDNLVVSSTTSKIGNSPRDFASTSSLLTPLGGSSGDVRGQDGFIGNIVHTSNLAARKTWEERVKDYDHSLNQNSDAVDSLVSANGTTGLRKQSLYRNNAACSQSFNESIFDQLNGGTSSVFRTNDLGESAADIKIEPNSNYLFEQAKVQDAFHNSCESLDDIISAMMKQDQNETIMMDGEFGFDANPLGSCKRDFGSCIRDFTGNS